MSVGGIICYPSGPYCPSHVLPSSSAIKQGSSRAAFLYSGAFERLQAFSKWELHPGSLFNANAQCTGAALPKRLYFQVTAESYIGRPYRWWQNGVQRNMKEIHSAHEFIDSVRNAGNGLVVVGFYSPLCGACRALHPKVCQLPESHPDVEFMLVNFEENRSLCYGLHIRVLPLFQFYRGAQGLLCTFSCTTATVWLLEIRSSLVPLFCHENILTPQRSKIRTLIFGHCPMLAAMTMCSADKKVSGCTCQAQYRSLQARSCRGRLAELELQLLSHGKSLSVTSNICPGEREVGCSGSLWRKHYS